MDKRRILQHKLSKTWFKKNQNEMISMDLKTSNPYLCVNVQKKKKTTHTKNKNKIHRLLAVILVLAILHNRWIWLKFFWNCKQIIEEKWSLCRLHFKLYSFSNKTRNEDQLFIRFSPIQEKSEGNIVSLLI